VIILEKYVLEREQEHEKWFSIKKSIYGIKKSLWWLFFYQFSKR
jgi:hypothetical protein